MHKYHSNRPGGPESIPIQDLHMKDASIMSNTWNLSRRLSDILHRVSASTIMNRADKQCPLKVATLRILIDKQKRPRASNSGNPYAAPTIFIYIRLYAQHSVAQHPVERLQHPRLLSRSCVEKSESLYNVGTWILGG